MLTGKTVAVGIGGGIGNALFNLPLLSALKELGARVVVHIGGDCPMSQLFARCVYIDETFVGDVGQADYRIAGPWCPPTFEGPIKRYDWPHELIAKNLAREGGDYPTYEWSLILEASYKFGWPGGRHPNEIIPDVSGWCRDLDRTPRWDVGIAPGCKPDPLWERKRYPGMRAVVEHFLGAGKSVALFGLPEDDEPRPLPGENRLGRYALHELPDALAGCGAFVGTDSGVTHLAASLGVPTVIVYTATSMMKGDPVGRRTKKIGNGVPCSPCQSSQRWHQCKDWICRKIDPNVVIGAVEDLL